MEVVCCICKQPVSLTDEKVVVVKGVGLLAHQQCLLDFIEKKDAGTP